MTRIHHNQLMHATPITAAPPMRNRIATAPSMPGSSAAAISGPISSQLEANSGVGITLGGSGATPNATTTAASSDITSNDFLSLLVSELKNQDPTAPTDPNTYVTQMVGVNSLQQLISINQDLT